jgi:hypothetical protein
MTKLVDLKSAFCGDGFAAAAPIIACGVIAEEVPKDTVWMGCVSLGSAAAHSRWSIGYSLTDHRVYADSVSGSGCFSDNYTLRENAGERCYFSLSDWGAAVSGVRSFSELPADRVNDEAAFAALVSLPPVSLSTVFNYARFELPETPEIELPYVTDWVSLEAPACVRKIRVPEGVKHVEFAPAPRVGIADTGHVDIYLPDTAVSCRVATSAYNVRLSIAPRLADNWSYWAALWGRHYKVPVGFVKTPDGRVVVRR